MNVAIIGNPVTNISSLKFLEKFLKIAKSFSNQIFVLNDGYPRSNDKSVKVIPATSFSRWIETRSNSTFGAILKFYIGQITYSLAILRHIRKAKVVFVFPITMFIPMLLCKLLCKKVVLYEAQDIWSENTGANVLANLRFHLLLQARSIALHAIDHMIVEGEKSIEVNRISDKIDMISILPQFVDCEHYYPGKSVGKRENIVSFIGTLESRKGALPFVEAAIAVMKERENVKFMVVGTGPLEQQIRELISKPEISDRISLFRNLSETAFRNLLLNSKLCVLPSRAEGMPNIVLESMASGAIVLVTPVGAIPNLIDDEKTGFLLREITPEHISDRIKYALDSPNLDSIGITARKLIEQNYSFSNAVARYRNFLHVLFSK